MIAELVWALGVVLCVEGLLVAVAPGRIDAALETFRRLPGEARRLLGLVALTVGVGLLALARGLGA